ncbi:MAG: universal stress protein, partial [Pseudomonadota bacterium]
MTTTSLVVGIDGSPAGDRALAFARDRASAIGDCTITVCYVVEWSPWAFQTAEENEQRHRRREEEIEVARERVVDPALEGLRAEGVEAQGVVRHGD